MFLCSFLGGGFTEGFQSPEGLLRALSWPCLKVVGMPEEFNEGDVGGPSGIKKRESGCGFCCPSEHLGPSLLAYLPLAGLFWRSKLGALEEAGHQLLSEVGMPGGLQILEPANANMVTEAAVWGQGRQGSFDGRSV